MKKIKIEITETQYSRMPNSINNHTMKKFTIENQTFWIDRETDTDPKSYRLYESGNGMILDYFCDGESWKSAIKFVEGFMTCYFSAE